MLRGFRLRFAVLSAVVLTLTAPGGARAADRSWIDSGGGIFSDSSNWSGGVIPGSSDRAVFNLAADYTVTFVTSPMNDRLRIGNDTVTFNLGGRTYRVTSTASSSMSVGGGLRFPLENGQLTLTGGTLAAVSADIGAGRFGSGTVIVSTGATWTNSQLLSVGLSGSGTIQAINGGDISADFATIGYDATGHASISGNGSTLTTTTHLDVGGNAVGTLSVQSGGQVSTTAVSLAAAPSSTGTATVDGSNSRWNQTGAFRVGEYGVGQLTLSNGGAIYNQSLSQDSMIADQYNSTGNASVNSSGQWTLLYRNLLVGHLGNATLNISNGGRVSVVNGNGFIAQGGGTGAVTVDGANSSWSVRSLYVGGDTGSSGGSGTLTVGNGGQVNVGYSEYLRIWGPGTVHLNAGGQITAGALLMSGGTFDWTGGELYLTRMELPIGPGGCLGANVSIGTGKTLRVANVVNVGVAGNGTLAASAGGQIASTAANIGYDAGRTGVATLDGAGTAWISNNSLSVGYIGTGQAAVTGGASMTSFGDSMNACGVVGDQGGSSGVATIDGAGSIWHAFADNASPSYFIVGNYGTGTLNIRNGGLVAHESTIASIGDKANSAGVVNVVGAGSRWTIDGYELDVGWNGSGTLNVESGGAVENPAGFTVIGANPGVHGESTIDGVGSRLAADVVTVANYGQGMLAIRNGGVVEAGTTYVGLGMNSTGSATVEGVGSRLTNITGDGYLIVGGAARGELTLRGGAESHSHEVFIGDGSTATGTLVAAGANTRLIADGELDVGFFGNGTLEIHDGAVVSTAFGSIGYGSGSTGRTVIDGVGSGWNLSDRLEVGGGTLGTLSVGEASVVAAAHALRINSNGTVSLLGGTIQTALLDLASGTLTGNGVVRGSMASAGRLEPGQPGGTISVDGAYAQSQAGRLVVRIGGVAGGQYSRLSVAQTASLNGALEVSSANGFVPAVGDSFEILTAGAVTGTFSALTLNGFNAGTQLAVEYGPTFVRLRFTAAPGGCGTCRGDLNGDHRRDGADIQALISCVLSHSPAAQCPCADLTADGAVDPADAAAMAELLMSSSNSECP